MQITRNRTIFPGIHSIAALFAMIPLVPVLFTMAVLWPGSIHAAGETWISRGPNTPVVWTMAVDPRTPQTLYAGTGGGVFKSTDGGRHWGLINVGLTNSSKSLDIRHLAIDPVTPQTLYAGTGAGVFKSTNAGETWSAVNNGLNSLYLTISVLAVDPVNPQTLYAGTGAGLFKSTNAGESWSPVNNGLTYLNNIDAIAIDPVNPLVIYVCSVSVYKSINGGTNWIRADNGFANRGAQTLLIDPKTPQTLYAGTMYGLFKSTNGGGNWSAVTNGPADEIITMAIDPVSPRTVYAITAHSRIYKSTDGGGSWTRTDLAANGQVLALAIDPASPQTLYAGTNGPGVFKTTNGGVNWNTANDGLSIDTVSALVMDPAQSQTVYATIDGAVYSSSDGGGNWSTSSVAPQKVCCINVLAIDPNNASVMYAGVDYYGMYKTINAGISWDMISTGITGSYVYALAMDPSTPQTLYAGTGYGGVFKTTDGGLTWNPVNNGLVSLYILALAIDPSTPQTLYAGTYRGLFKSTNGGVNWSAINTGLTEKPVQVLAIDPTTPQTLYAGTYGAGVFKSTNGGANWSAVNSGLTTLNVSALALDPTNPGTLYAGTGGGKRKRDTEKSRGLEGGVFKSTNSGESWSALTGWLPTLGVNALAIQTKSPINIVYAGTEGGGVFMSSAVTQNVLTLPAGGAVLTSTPGTASAVTAGYAVGTVNSGSAPYGTAVFSYKQNGAVVSEVGVPTSPPTLAARFFVDSRAKVSQASGSGTIDILTGFAAVNANNTTANLSLKLRDSNGSTLAQGIVRLARGEHIAKFLDQLAPDFVLPSGFITNGLGSLEITSDQSVSILALRLTINQRSDLLLTSTPIADLTKPAPTAILSFPQIADGGGYQTTLILMNTSNALETGVVRFYGNHGAALAVRMTGASGADTGFGYSIPAGGFLRLVTDGSPSNVNVGWAQLTPDSGMTAPVSAAIFSLTQLGTLATESGVPAVTPTTHARIYVDKSSGHDTGLAIANPGSKGIRITGTAFQLDGVTRAGSGQGTMDLSSMGHDARFAGQLVAGLPQGFTGVLDLSSPAPFTALTLRSLMNSRGDFLVTTFPIADVNQPPPTPLVFPQIADGGGYQTQIILLSTSGATSTITVSYMGNDGSPIAVGQGISNSAVRGPNPR